MDATTIPLVLADIMTACVAAFDPPGAPAAPARRFCSHGQQPIVEGEQLTVTCVGISSVHPFPLQGLRAIRSTVVPSAGITIEIWRTCWPTAQGSAAQRTMPNPTKLNAAALTAAADGSCLYGALARLITAGTLCPSLPLIGTADDFAISPALPLGPQAQVVGWRIPIAVKLTTT
jgi:hypothetical protein